MESNRHVRHWQPFHWYPLQAVKGDSRLRVRRNDPATTESVSMPATARGKLKETRVIYTRAPQLLLGGETEWIAFDQKAQRVYLMRELQIVEDAAPTVRARRSAAKTKVKARKRAPRARRAR